jgi:hypothetical protein
MEDVMPKRLTTADLEAAIRAIDTVSREIAEGFTRHPPGWVRRLRHRLWQRAQDLRQYYGLTRRTEAAVAATQALTATLAELVALQILHPVTAELYQQQIRTVEQQHQQQTAASTPTRLTGSEAPATDTAERRGRLIRVTRQIHQLVLYHIGSTGINRPWRIAQRIQRTHEYTTGYLENAVSQLSRDREVCPALLAPVDYQDEPARYPYKASGRRTLYWLTPAGQHWYAQAYGQPAVPSELPSRIKAHHGLVHAVDILEARDLFTALGLEVQEEPEPLLYTDDVWGPRSEPDLLLTDADGAWPVEVQRDIRAAHATKWAKALDLAAGRLIIVLETAQDRARQARLLRNAAHRLPPGQIRLIDLWTLRSLVGAEQAGAVPWVEIATGNS